MYWLNQHSSSKRAAGASLRSIDELKWSSHVNSVAYRKMSTLGFWWRNLRCCPTKLKATAYTSLVRSTMEYHYCDVIMGAMASKITGLTIVYLAVYPGADQRKHHSSASLAFVRGIHRWPGNSPHKWPVTRQMFPFDDVIMGSSDLGSTLTKGCPGFRKGSTQGGKIYL